MNPSAHDDDPSDTIAIDEVINFLNQDDEETKKLKQAEMERQEKAKEKADQIKAKGDADKLTRRLIKHAANIRNGTPANVKGGNVLANARNKCAASLQVRSLPLSPSMQTVNQPVNHILFENRLTTYPRMHPP